jgi:hypothetical protein
MTGRPVVHDFATAAQSSDEHRKAERQLDLENRNQKLEIVDLRKQLELATKALAESQGVVNELHVSRPIDQSIPFPFTHFHSSLISTPILTGRQ